MHQPAGVKSVCFQAQSFHSAMGDGQPGEPSCATRPTGLGSPLPLPVPPEEHPPAVHSMAGQLRINSAPCMCLHALTPSATPKHLQNAVAARWGHTPGSRGAPQCNSRANAGGS